jgi:endonuclease/exonuclease/phosphatase (EEP) superfamily protein YafD
VHLENTARPSGRTRQATALASALSDGPLIVGGDVNTLFGPLEGVAGAFEAAGLERIPLRYGRWLSPSIDQIFVRGASCAAGEVLRLRGSDHFPIVAEVEFAAVLPGAG